MFRSLGKSKIAFVLAILFGISLFFFKGGSRYSNLFNSDTVVATVSGTPISTSKFNRTMQMNINKFNQMLGKPITGDEIRSFQIHSLSLGALINDAVFENEYDSIKLIIDESVVAQKTKERIPLLYDKNNKLNETYLNTFLKQQQLKIEDIVQIINFETRDEFVNNALFNINYPQYFSSKIDNYNNHSRKISYIEFLLEEVNIENDIQKYALNMKEELEKYYEVIESKEKVPRQLRDRVSRGSAISKAYVSEVASRAITTAIEIQGLAGIVDGSEIERGFRDSFIAEIYEGTNDIQRMIIAKELLGLGL